MFKLGDRVKVVSGNLYKGRLGTAVADDGDPILNYIVCFEATDGDGYRTLSSVIGTFSRHVPDLHKYYNCLWDYFSMDELQSMVKYYPNTSLFRKLYPQGIVEGKFLKVVDNN